MRSCDRRKIEKGWGLLLQVKKEEYFTFEKLLKLFLTVNIKIIGSIFWEYFETNARTKTIIHLNLPKSIVSDHRFYHQFISLAV